MQIQCLGLSHHTAEIALRERLAFSPENTHAALARLGCGGAACTSAIQELVILSTCNRVELYAATQEIAWDELENFLSEVKGLPRAAFTPYVYRYANEAAVKHLLIVASGLDSQVLGEPQILGQVTQAFSLARSQGSVGKILSRLFQTAIRAGKRARTETMISHNPASTASVAVHLITQILPEISNAEITVIGAGEMAELAVQSLIKRGASHIRVVNRTLERAESLAQKWNGQAATFEQLPDLMASTDVVITSTGAPHTLVHADMLEGALQSRPNRPLVIMDIAVPRDVDSEVSELPGVYLYDIDALSSRLEESLSKRIDEIPKVESILLEEQADFINYLLTLDILPVIIELRHQANQIREQELSKTLRRLQSLSPDEQECITALTKSIVKKLLHTPTVRLRSEANGPNAADYANITRGLFGLE